MGVMIFNNIMWIVFLGTIDEEYGTQLWYCIKLIFITIALRLVRWYHCTGFDVEISKMSLKKISTWKYEIKNVCINKVKLIKL